MRRATVVFLAAMLAGVGLTACTSSDEPKTSTPSSPAPSAGSAETSSARASSQTSATRAPPSSAMRVGAALPRPAHVVIVVFENTAEHSVIGTGAAPYLDQLAASGALFTNSHAITHPSEPNYLDLFSGSDQGVRSDSCPHTFSAPNLGAALIARGDTFAGYSEDLPAVGSTACSAPSPTAPKGSGYARKHNPWVNFADVPASANQSFTAFPSDYARLPTVSWVIPNLCHDMHDCAIATGDAWLRNTLGDYAEWAQTHDSLLIVTFDENDGSSGNRIATIFDGQSVRPGAYGERIDHFSVLRTVEDMYGLPHTGAAASARPITDVWR